jgi:hypothetical protein
MVCVMPAVFRSSTAILDALEAITDHGANRYRGGVASRTRAGVPCYCTGRLSGVLSISAMNLIFAGRDQSKVPRPGDDGI